VALDGTYAGLQASVADFLNRADLTATIPDFIAMAEAQINTRLRVRRMVATSTASVSSEFAALPSDFLGPISATTANNVVMDCVSVDALAEMKRCGGVETVSGNPVAYAVVGSQFQFYRAPTDAVDVDLVYYAKLPSLASAGGNWLLTDRPDIYLYGALLQSAPYLQDDVRIATWANLFTTLLDDLARADARETYGARLTPRTSQYA
jgi:hypothetical protein